MPPSTCAPPSPPSLASSAACLVDGVVPWCEACAAHMALINRTGSGSPLHSRWRAHHANANANSSSVLLELSSAQLAQAAREVASLLEQRGVLCNRNAPCTVSAVGGTQTQSDPMLHHVDERAGAHVDATHSKVHSRQPGQRRDGPALIVCPAKGVRRIYCAPFANDRTTFRKARRLATGCLAPSLPCQRFDIGRIASDLDRLRSHEGGHREFSDSHTDDANRHAKKGDGAFFGPADVDEVYARIARQTKSQPLLHSAMQAMEVPAAQSIGKCALVGANHMLRCRHWGARFDSKAYDAIFRVNGFQIDRKRVPNQWLDERHAGVRTTHRQSCMTLGKRLNSTRGELCLLTPDFLSSQVSHADHTQVCGGPGLRSEYTERSVASATALGYRFALFARGAPYRSLSGVGSGDAASLVALALCRELHVYGVGLFGRRLDDGSFELVYQHAYDPGLASCHPSAVNTSCGDQASYVGSQLVREAQWAVWHVLRVARWFWE